MAKLPIDWRCLILKKTITTLELSLMEKTILSDALKNYIDYCNKCLSLPENKDQEVFIRGDIDVCQRILNKIST